MNTKSIKIIFVVAAVLAVNCFGTTYFRLFDGALPPTDCNIYVGGGSGGSSLSWQTGSVGGGYLRADLHLNQNNDGVAKVYIPIGDVYPKDTAAGQVTKSWFQFDVKTVSGSSSRQTAAVGVFNNAGDTDTTPQDLYNYASVGILGNGTVLKLYPRMSGTPNPMGGTSCRVKVRIFNNDSASASYIDVWGYDIDSAGNVSETPSYIGGGTFLGSGTTLAVTLDSFGIHNLRSTSSTQSSVFLFDNLYFSTDEAAAYMPPPSWCDAPTPDADALKIIAQPESCELYFDEIAGTHTKVTTANSDANLAYLGYNNAADHNDGSLVLAFKLPQLPAGKIINSATLKWYYVDRYRYHRLNHDLYVLPSRPASTDPLVDAEKDYYMGVEDTNDAMLLAKDVADSWNFTDGGYTATINQWRSTDPSSDALAMFMQKQYDNGAVADDWLLIRFSPDSNVSPTYREAIKGPRCADANYRPYIEYTLGEGGRIAAQPETSEVFNYSTILPTSCADANLSRLSYTGTSEVLYNGSLVLAFRAPQLPPDKVVSKVTLEWYYKNYYVAGRMPLDLYAIPFRLAAINPPINTGDYYCGTIGDANADPTDAVRIQQNIAYFAALDPSLSGDIQKWAHSDFAGVAFGEYLRDQYDDGAVANDWILIRVSPTVKSTSYRCFNIRSPWYIDPNYRPYLKYELGDYWKPVVMETPVTINEDGVLSNPPGNLGCFDTTGAGNSDFKNAELIVPFQFPQLETGEYVSEVQFSCTWGGCNVNGRFDVDLYGLPYRGSTAFQSSDYWVGPYAPQAGDVPDMNCGTPIAGDVFDSKTYSVAEPWSIDPNGSRRLACYINDLKTAGAAASDYGFLRLGQRFDFYRYENNVVSNFAMQAKIVHTSPTCLDAPETEGACLKYDNPDKLLSDRNSDCTVTLEDFALLAEHWMQ